MTEVKSNTQGHGVVRALGTTVAAWGAANVVGGSALAVSGRGPGVSAFGQQCATWGAINLAIAGFGFWRSRSKPADLPRLRTILLVNAALDVGYMAVGVALIGSVRGRTDPHAEVRRGHGAAIIVQGAGLGAIDTVYAAAVTRALHHG